MTQAILLFVEKHINLAHKSCHPTDKICIRAVCDEPHCGGKLMREGQGERRPEHRLSHQLRESTNYPHWEVCMCVCVSAYSRCRGLISHRDDERTNKQQASS